MFLIWDWPYILLSCRDKAYQVLIWSCITQKGTRLYWLWFIMLAEHKIGTANQEKIVGMTYRVLCLMVLEVVLILLLQLTICFIGVLSKYFVFWKQALILFTFFARTDNMFNRSQILCELSVLSYMLWVRIVPLYSFNAFVLVYCCWEGVICKLW